GYFVMTAPGRLAYKEPPVPLTRGLLKVHTLKPPLDRTRIVDALKIGIREKDRFINQLQSMKRVARDGEPELAVLGVVSPLEWYANSFVLPPTERYKTSHSLRRALDLPPLSHLSQDLKTKLVAIADLRNGLVHGTPPARDAARPVSRLDVASVLQD